jgi:Ca2+-binding RTX toxin-like protein
VTGGFAFRHETDEYGSQLLEAIGGVSCPEPTDYFIGGYTVPDTEDLPPGEGYIDTGKFRGCTLGDEQHLRGRWQSNGNSSIAGDFELVLDSTNEAWTGTYTADGDPIEYTWTGFFQNHFDGDGANVISDPPYDSGPPDTEPGGGTPPPPGGATNKCNDKEATITPNPDAPAGLAISGTAADDVIVGTDGPDRILGLGGNDTICGFGGNDEIVGADGDDTIFAGAGNDTVDAGPGMNYVKGETGDDQLLAGDDRNYLEGGPGNDKLQGGSAKDSLYGNEFQLPLDKEPAVKPDADQLIGGGGSDLIYGQAGNDKIEGGAGDDNLFAGTGSDFVNGGEGADRLDGGPGNDKLDGGTGGEHPVNGAFGDQVGYYQDYVTASVRVILMTGIVKGGGGRDIIRNVETIQGSRFDDLIRGSGGSDTLAGGLGNDDIYGLTGNDRLFGGADDDLLLGGPGLDGTYGSEGFDICAGERRSGCERLRVGGG